MRIAPALSILIFSVTPCALFAGPAFDSLSPGRTGEHLSPSMAVSAPVPAGYSDAVQYLPPDNDNPGFKWPAGINKDDEDHYLRTGSTAAYLKASEENPEQLQDGSGKCLLRPDTIYRLRAAPVFEAQHIIADLEEPPAGCTFSRGRIYMPQVSSTSAGGLWELPVNVRAFLDTLAFAEGTREHYNYLYTFASFRSYTDHPRKRICGGGICSTAAGRYQFLTKTWDSLAKSLSLTDFTPPSQEKAALEIIRRRGAYPAVLNSSAYANFSKAINKLNTIWASLPGSPYGQPTHSMEQLWAKYKASLASHK